MIFLARATIEVVFFIAVQKNIDPPPPVRKVDTLGTGNLKGLVLSESQPMAPGTFAKMDWATVMATPRFSWLMVIDALGVSLTLAGTLPLVVFAGQFNPLQDWQSVMGLATLGLALVAVGGYAFRSAHTLWGQFAFEFTLTWIEMKGSFIRSKIDLGNRLQDRVFTERDMVNVENMTLRVWITGAGRAGSG